MTNSTSIECAHILENGQVDFIITNYPNSGLLNTHSVRAIREFRDVFVASAEHFPLQDKTFTLAELLDYPIMMLDRKSTTSEFYTPCHEPISTWSRRSSSAATIF